MFIIEVEGDGNCLFRAISDQIYGTEKFHRYIRKITMDYIEIEKDFFVNYIVGENNNDFENYVKWKREDGVWGDDVEI